MHKCAAKLCNAWYYITKTIDKAHNHFTQYHIDHSICAVLNKISNTDITITHNKI